MKLFEVRYPTLASIWALALVVGTSAAALATPYVPPSGIGAPGRRESAGTRGCAFGNPASLIALMPTENIGLTANPYPRFYWYVPVSQAQFLEFTLSPMGANGTVSDTPIYTTRLAVPEDAGIVSLELPETANLPLLQAGDRYHWQVAAFCNPQSENGDLQVQGWVEYQPPTAGLQSVLDVLSESDQASLYAQNGYWFDAVDHFATLNAAAPEDALLQTRWAELLLSVDLDTMVDQPLILTDTQN
ncbi:MAG: DUF928 domain-containing protein [Cyanobacteria bacterium P01_D01_bin.6]